MTKIAVVVGGPSSEAAVSRVSGESVRRALGTAGYATEVLELDGHLTARLVELAPVAVFPCTHGPLGEDGCLQGLLETLALRYVGSGVLASALAANKPAAKVHFRAAGLPVASEVVVQRGEVLLERAREARACLGRAVVVKPGSGGSAIGVTRVPSSADDGALVAALERALAFDSTALVEDFVVGYEVTCGVLDVGEGGPQALPPTLIESKASGWYDFTSRYARAGSVHQCPAPFDASLIAEIQRVAVAGFRALGARDLGRLDFVVGTDGCVTLLELNTLPGMTATSLFPEAAAVAGVPFPDLCRGLVQRALQRPLRPTPEVVPMPS